MEEIFEWDGPFLKIFCRSFVHVIQQRELSCSTWRTWKAWHHECVARNIISNMDRIKSKILFCVRVRRGREDWMKNAMPSRWSIPSSIRIRIQMSYYFLALIIGISRLDLKSNEKICILLMSSLVNQNKGLQCVTGSECHGLDEITRSTTVLLN